MAQAMFNRLSKHQSTSAGTMVLEMDGQTVAKRAEVAPSGVLVLELMSEEEDQDLSSEQRTQLTPELVDAADKVIVMAERETWPDYLVESGKVSSGTSKTPSTSPSTPCVPSKTRSKLGWRNWSGKPGRPPLVALRGQIRSS